MKQIYKEILKEEVKNTKQRIISLLILCFLFSMILSTVEVGQAATANTNLVQNIIAGSLGVSAPDNVDFTDVTLNGSNQNSNSNLNGVVVTDVRGGDGDGWNLTLYAENNLVAGTNNISIEARLNVAPGDVSSDDTAQAGSNFMMPNNAGGAEVLMNAGANCGTGTSNIDNTLLMLLVESTDVAGDYAAVIIFTVS